MDDKLKIIARHYGKQQVLKLVEEMAELIQAIAKYEFNDSAKNLDNLIEEIADVEIVLEQVKYLSGIDRLGQLKKIKQAKIERTLQRIYEEKVGADSGNRKTTSNQ